MLGLHKFPKFKSDAIPIYDISLFSKLASAIPLQAVSGRNAIHLH